MIKIGTQHVPLFKYNTTNNFANAIFPILLESIWNYVNMGSNTAENNSCSSGYNSATQNTNPSATASTTIYKSKTKESNNDEIMRFYDALEILGFDRSIGGISISDIENAVIPQMVIDEIEKPYNDILVEQENLNNEINSQLTKLRPNGYSGDLSISSLISAWEIIRNENISPKVGETSAQRQARIDKLNNATEIIPTLQDLKIKEENIQQEVENIKQQKEQTLMQEQQKFQEAQGVAIEFIEKFNSWDSDYYTLPQVNLEALDEADGDDLEIAGKRKNMEGRYNAAKFNLGGNESMAVWILNEGETATLSDLQVAIFDFKNASKEGNIEAQNVAAYNCKVIMEVGLDESEKQNPLYNTLCSVYNDVIKPWDKEYARNLPKEWAGKHYIK